MTVPQLKTELEKRGLETNGLKADLLKRLESAVGTDTTSANGTSSTAAAASATPVKQAAATSTTPASTPVAKPATTKPAATPKTETTKPAAKVDSKPVDAAKPAASPAPSSAAPSPASPSTLASTEPADGSGEGKVVSLNRPKQDLMTSKQQRAQKFGIEVKMSDEEKRSARTSRFGVDTAVTLATTGNRKRKPNAVASPEEQEKTAARAKRFGLPSPAATDEKMLKRAKKFGTAVPAGVVDPAEAEKRQKRSARFSDSASKPTDAPAGDASAAAAPAAST